MAKNEPAVRQCPSWGAMSLASLLTKLAHSRRNDVFVAVENGESLTFYETQLRVRTLAQFFAEQGMGTGDCVLLRQGRKIDGLIALLACARLGLDICIVPEGMSAREVVEGAAPLTPKIVLDAGQRDPDRSMEMAAGLFTVRLVGGFSQGQPNMLADDMVDCSPPALKELGVGKDGLAEPAQFEPERHALIHYLRPGASERVERMTRTQSHLLSQALANAMMMQLTTKSIIGTAYDPLGTNGLVTVLAPAIVVGTAVRLFDGLNPNVAEHVTDWCQSTQHAVSVMPLSVRIASPSIETSDRLDRIWISPTVPKLDATSSTLSEHELLLVDLGGVCFAKAFPTEEHGFGVASGPIKIAGNNGQIMVFGTLGLRATAKDNGSRGSLLNGEITLEGPMATRRDGHIWQVQRTGMLARAIDQDDGTVLYALSERERDVRVGAQSISLAKVNRCLMLTGRWQDAAAYSVADPMVGVRLEVAVQPRLTDEGAIADGAMPTLDDVRGLLRDSGISDAMLPTVMHLVTSVPRGLSGNVVVDELAEKLIPVETAPSTMEDDLSDYAAA